MTLLKRLKLYLKSILKPKYKGIKENMRRGVYRDCIKKDYEKFDSIPVGFLCLRCLGVVASVCDDGFCKQCGCKEHW